MMLNLKNNEQRFFDADAKLASAFDFAAERTVWMTCAQIAEVIEVPVTVGSSNQIAHALSRQNVARRKSGSVRLVLMPARCVAKIEPAAYN